MAEYFEVKCKQADKNEILVAGGGSIDSYQIPFQDHNIVVSVGGMRIKESIQFVRGQELPLLGEDFFKYGKILFDRPHKKFSIEPV